MTRKYIYTIKGGLGWAEAFHMQEQAAETVRMGGFPQYHVKLEEDPKKPGRYRIAVYKEL